QQVAPPPAVLLPSADVLHHSILWQRSDGFWRTYTFHLEVKRRILPLEREAGSGVYGKSSTSTPRQKQYTTSPKDRECKVGKEDIFVRCRRWDVIGTSN
ncbi:unnamed protein product, partial [Musa hybrid cultivar]